MCIRAISSSKSATQWWNCFVPHIPKKKKISRLNKLDLRREGDREPSDHLVYPQELGCRCKSPAGRTLKDKLSETRRKAELGRLATEWTAHGERTSKHIHTRTRVHTHTHSVTSWTKAKQEAQRVSRWTAGACERGWEVTPRGEGIGALRTREIRETRVVCAMRSKLLKDGLEICQQEQMMAWTLVTKMMVIYGHLLVRLPFLILF